MKMFLLIALLVSSGVERATALTIIRDFQGGTPPTNSVGSGNLTNIFNQACDVWELAIRDNFTLTLHYEWAPNGGGTQNLIAQGGNPNRETEGLIQFNNDNIVGHFAWYMDANPLVQTNTAVYFEESKDLGAGAINETRCYTWPTAMSETDLFTTALHEIGHALGISYGNTSFIAESVDGDIDITPTRPYPGMIVPLQTNNNGVVSHIAYLTWTAKTLMSGANGGGMRVMPSVLDIVTLAQLSKFDNLNLDLSPELKTSAGYNDQGQPIVTLSWIQPIGTHVVETCVLGQTIWTTLDATPVANSNGVYSVTIPATGQSSLFRLKRQ